MNIRIYHCFSNFIAFLCNISFRFVVFNGFLMVYKYLTKPNNTQPKLQYLVNSVWSNTAFSKRYSQSFNTSLLFNIRQMSSIEWPRKGSYYGMVTLESHKASVKRMNTFKKFMSSEAITHS